MKAKFGAIVTDGLGKLGDVVASKNRAGSFFRERVDPVDTPSSFKTSARALFASVSSAWKGLSQSQRDAWDSSILLFPYVDKFGSVRYHSGFHLFVKLNTVRLICSQSVLSLPPVKSEFVPINVVSLYFDNTAQYAEVILSENVTHGRAVLIYASKGVSQGVGRFHGQLALIKVVLPNSYYIQGVHVQYIARFGSIPPIGEKVFVKVVTAQLSSGFVASPTFSNQIIPF